MNIKEAILECVVNGEVCTNWEANFAIQFNRKKSRLEQKQNSLDAKWGSFDYTDIEFSNAYDGWAIERVIEKTKDVEQLLKMLKHNISKAQAEESKGKKFNIVMLTDHIPYISSIVELAEKQLASEKEEVE